MQFFMRHWLLVFIMLFGALNILPFVAPIFMEVGWETGGSAIYTLYGALCHQMAQRSFFLFGEGFMFNADQLPVNLTGNPSVDTLALRHFRGNDTLGWKVAWSDRMVYLYGSFWLTSLAYYFRTRRGPMKPVSIWIFIGGLIPMFVDGTTHFISDFDGITRGFRYSNDWLATLTGNTLPESFYVGDALGSFNSLMRLLSGMVFGIGVAIYFLPLVDYSIRVTQNYRTYQANKIHHIDHAIKSTRNHKDKKTQ